MKNRVKYVVITSIGSVLGIGLLIMLLRAAPTQARATATEDLKPASRVTSLGATDWQTVTLDGFDGTYTTTYAVQKEITHTGVAGYEWGRVLTSATGLTDTLWCVGSAQSAGLDPDTGVYTDGVTTTLTYGPMDWRDVVTAEISFRHWISLAGGDAVEWGISADGEVFSYSSISSTAGTWNTETIRSETDVALASLRGKQRAYLSFRFHSDGDGQVDRGVFLDDVQVRVRRERKVYFPLVSSEYYDPYLDTFDNDKSGWPTWAKYTLNSVAENHWGGYKMYADGKAVYYVGIFDDGDEVFLTGPVRTPKDFVFEVEERWAHTTERWGNEVGVLLSDRPIDPGDAHTFEAYVFIVQINNGYSVPHRGVVKHWVRRYWDDDVDKVVKWDHLEPEYFKHTDGAWNKFRVERKGATFTFKVARVGSGRWRTVGSFTDPHFRQDAYVGFFAAHEPTYSYLLEWEFDNVSLDLNR